MKALEWLALIIVVVAAISTGIAAIFNWSLLNFLFGWGGTLVWQIVGVVIGVAGVILLITRVLDM